ncbi:MAG: helical backbone metal receptor [Sphingobacteriales bacterium]|jgi:ABC-type Fe3+-hydroxamate transport system substrate-binding protein|nr:helical backbone metal receptor [Sphingobacteriales bacterium]
MKHVFTDQMGREVSLQLPIQRIVSLVPSQTELLYDLGQADSIVGQTMFCIHPDWAHESKPRVGGTKKLNLNKIRALKPDLIIGNKEENAKAQIEELMQEFPVWMSDISDLTDALDMMLMIGEFTNSTNSAQKLVSEITQSFNSLPLLQNKKRVLYLIWRDPWMAAGNHTFIGDMLKRCGWINVAVGNRYPEMVAEQIIQANPDKILLSSEPYPFKEKHIEELQQICPKAHIHLVDGELFSWYGSRLLGSADYFKQLLNS